MLERLIKAARDGRYGLRDATLILLAYRHGLRAVEIFDLEWSQVEFGRNATLHVRRAKNGKPSAHPLRGDEIRALRELHRQFPDSGFVFEPIDGIRCERAAALSGGRRTVCWIDL
jgi:type 1 fimbriae regulatory protein FimE